MKRQTLGTLASTLILTWAADAQDSLRTLVPEQEAFRDFEVSQSALDVQLFIDNPQGFYRVDETLELSVLTNMDAYVTIVGINDDNQVTVLFPYADANEDNFIQADTLTAVSGTGTGLTLRFQEPVGTDLVKAFATTEYIPLMDPAHLQQIPGGRLAVSDLGARTLLPEIETVIEETPQDGALWATDSVTVTSYTGNLPATHMDPGQTTTVTEPFALTLHTDKLVYSVGEPVAIRVQSDTDCSLALYNIGTSGAVRQIFPNQSQRDPQIKAGQALDVPGPDAQILAVGPTGAETLLALCAATGHPAIAQEQAFVEQMFPNIGDLGSLNQRNLTLITTPAAPELALGATVRAATAIIVR